MRYDVSRYLLTPGKCQASYRIYSQWARRTPILAITRDDEEWGAQAMLDLGIPPSAWFVCVHVREPGYSPVDEELHSHRNGSIEATLPALLEIVRQGGYVIRIGDPTMRKLSPMSQVIDYAHHPMKCERLDVILCAKARFILGNTSGIALVGSIFGVPCAIANTIPVPTLWFNELDISIPKLLWSNRLGRYLSLSESIAIPIGTYHYASLYEKAGIRADENSPEDILELVVEMLANLSGEFSGEAKATEIQLQYRALLDDRHYSYGSVANFANYYLKKDATINR